MHGYSSGQKCTTLNTAEAEYIALVKGLQFAIWMMLMLRELSFRLGFPIPVLPQLQPIQLRKKPLESVGGASKMSFLDILTNFSVKSRSKLFSTHSDSERSLQDLSIELSKSVDRLSVKSSPPPTHTALGPFLSSLKHEECDSREPLLPFLPLE